MQHLAQKGVLNFLSTTKHEERKHTTTSNNALLNGGTGGGEGVDEAVLLLTDLDLRGTTDLDHGDTIRKLGEALLEFLEQSLGV